MTYTKETEFKGHPVMNICYLKDSEEKTLISFGVNKADGICEHIDEIRLFVEKHKKEGKRG